MLCKLERGEFVEQALAGVRVLDLSHFIAGPYCTRILAGFGAEVIKIEKPGQGDIARSIGPFLDDEPGTERSGLFLYLNGNKKSVTLNLKSAGGVKLFKELVRDADILVESFRPGVMRRLGLGYTVLEKINPGLVMTSVSNFGQSGPYRDYKASHLVLWGMNGGRYTNGQPEMPPWQGPNWLSDYMSGCQAANGTMVALYQRNATGIGQHVDVSMHEVMMQMVLHPAVMYSYLKKTYFNLAICYLGIFPCKDGYIGINMLTQPQWQAICRFFGMPELAEDPRYQNLAMIVEHLEEVRALFAPKIAEWKAKELFQAAVEWRIPAGLVPTAEEIIKSPQHIARGFLEEVCHPVMGKVVMPGAPAKLMESPWQTKSAAPLLGEHNIEIYSRLGYAKSDMVRLRENGII
ncbi:MAG: CoA transferase [Dehalococcoidales bacterium]|nr:CoA transferase [Dehalococcoidales bacterium]